MAPILGTCSKSNVLTPNENVGDQFDMFQVGTIVKFVEPNALVALSQNVALTANARPCFDVCSSPEHSMSVHHWWNDGGTCWCAPNRLGTRGRNWPTESKNLWLWNVSVEDCDWKQKRIGCGTRSPNLFCLPTPPATVCASCGFTPQLPSKTMVTKSKIRGSRYVQKGKKSTGTRRAWRGFRQELAPVCSSGVGSRVTAKGVRAAWVNVADQHAVRAAATLCWTMVGPCILNVNLGRRCLQKHNAVDVSIFLRVVLGVVQQRLEHSCCFGSCCGSSFTRGNASVHITRMKA